MMKRLFVSVVSLMLFVSAGAQSLTRVEFVMKNASFSVGKEGAEVSYAFELSQDIVAKGFCAVILPSLVGSGERVNLTPFVIFRGDDRLYRNKLRDQSFNVTGDNREQYVVSGHYHGEVRMSETVERKPWMDSCVLNLSVMERTKKGEYNVISRRKVASFCKEAEPEVVLGCSQMAPSEDAGNLRTVVKRMVLGFEPSSNSYNNDYGDNAEQMRSCVDYIRSLGGNRNLTYRSSVLRCWTGIEGPARRNQSNSRARALSLLNWMQRRGVISRNATSVGMGENWEGMVRWLSESTLSEDADLMKMLDSGDVDKTESEIRTGKSRVWEIMRKNCFPGLESVEVKLTYAVSGLNDTRVLAELAESFPEILSEWDFWRLSTRYGERSDEWNDVVLLAAEVHPDSRLCNMNAASALLSSGYTREAMYYLNRSGDSPEAEYLWAVWMYKEGRIDDAIATLSRLVTMGYRGYSERLRALRALRDWQNDGVSWDCKLLY